MNTQPDARVFQEGTVYLLDALTPRADRWLKKNLRGGRIYLNGALVVEHRYIVELCKGMMKDELVVEDSRKGGE